MAVFIQDANGKKYYYDAVFSVTYVQRGNPTQYAMESGALSSDHYSQDQDTISIQGDIGEAKIKEKDESSGRQEFLEGLMRLKKSGTFFTVSFTDSFITLKNCLFTQLSYEQSSETGKYTTSVTAEIKSVTVANQAQVVSTPRPMEDFREIVQDKKKTNTSTVPESDNANLQKSYNAAAKVSGLPQMEVINSGGQ